MNTIIYPEHFFSLIPKRWPDRGTMSPIKKTLPGWYIISARHYLDNRVDIRTGSGCLYESQTVLGKRCLGSIARTGTPRLRSLRYAGRDLTQKLVEIYGGL